MLQGFDKGDYINGARILGQARSISDPSPAKERPDLRQVRYQSNALCVVDKLLTPIPPTKKDNVIRKLRGYKIIGRAKSIGKTIVFHMTGPHRGQKNTLEGEAFCIIDAPLHPIPQH